MKKTAVCIIIILCVFYVSCESLFERAGKNRTFEQTYGANVNASSSSQRRSSNSASQSSNNNTNSRAAQDTANWNIAALDTAANVSYLTNIEKDVILETNMVRTNPRKYAELYLQPRLKYFNGRNYSVPGQITIATKEGASAVSSCITALNRASAVGVLTPESGLSRAAKDHVTDQSRTGQTGHNGSNRSTPESRIKQHGTFGRSYTFGENIAYGDTTGRDIVCSLLIDDGVPGRGHRTNIMNGAFTQTGVAFGTHKQYRTSCTITYANGYTSK